MVLAAPGLLLTPPPSSCPPKTPHRSYSAKIQSHNPIMKRRPPPKKTVPAPTDENLTYTITQTPFDVQSSRAPALKNTCHDARFAPHVGANVRVPAVPHGHVLYDSRSSSAAGKYVSLTPEIASGLRGLSSIATSTLEAIGFWV